VMKTKEWPDFKSPYLRGVVQVFKGRSKSLSHRGSFRAYGEAADILPAGSREWLVVEQTICGNVELRMSVWSDGELALDVEGARRKKKGPKLVANYATPVCMVDARRVLAFFEGVERMLPTEWPKANEASSLRNQVVAQFGELVEPTVPSADKRLG